jgi:hypothetical protein
MKLIYNLKDTGNELVLFHDYKFLDVGDVTEELNLQATAEGTIATLKLMPDAIHFEADQIRLKIGDKIFKLWGMMEEK